ncbi:hypothetical protein Dvul_0941 [Nitratidesulfovibrio vulgaris DP4]|uniref:Uncharacterized protein n=1 Tax=Nitratidesulfovibrio vulgaris (strain DP4) TaxID=391774 RepID=A0A0H3A904_NITV4|nr:hypothetical protein Dvul_0941 [Nitratidesulfovibrio vulgaris DP4]
MTGHVWVWCVRVSDDDVVAEMLAEACCRAFPAREDGTRRLASCVSHETMTSQACTAGQGAVVFRSMLRGGGGPCQNALPPAEG